VSLARDTRDTRLVKIEDFKELALVCGA